MMDRLVVETEAIGFMFVKRVGNPTPPRRLLTLGGADETEVSLAI